MRDGCLKIFYTSTDVAIFETREYLLYISVLVSTT